MRKFFTVIARIIATIFSIFFVVTTILVILMTTLNQQVFNANLYKKALVEQDLYGRMPELVGVAITSMSDFLSNPCGENPLACNIDGASPELQACLTDALGPEVYEEIGRGQRNPTDAELQLAQPCLDQFASQHTASNYQPGETLPNASPEVQDCVKQAIGEQAYNELFDNQRLPEDTEEQLMSPCLAQLGGGDEGGMPSFFKNLTAANWQAIITILLPPEDLQLMTESTVDQIFAYLNGQADTAAVPLDKLKERLAGPGGRDLIMQLIDSQPPCTGEEAAQMSGGMDNGGMVLCKPSADDLPAVLLQLQGQLDTAIQQIPDQATILKPPSTDVPPSGNNPFGTDPISILGTLRLVIRLSPILPLVFLLFVTLFAVRSLKSWMRWWGIPIFFSGAIALVLGVLAMPAVNAAWSMLILPRIPPVFPPDIAAIGLGFARSVGKGLSQGIVIRSVILLAFGLAAWIGSYFIRLKGKSVVPEPAPTLAS